MSVNISPALTTMRMNVQRIAEIAVTELARQIENQFDEGAMTDPPDQGQSVPMELIVRDSSGPPPSPAVDIASPNHSNNPQPERANT